MSGWIGVDLDGTLATYGGYLGPNHIGAPIPAMVERVKRWLAAGTQVKIFTARVDGGTAAINLGNPNGHEFENIEKVKEPIRAWCREHLGQELEITNTKDFGMVVLYDDRAVQVEMNTGRILGKEL